MTVEPNTLARRRGSARRVSSSTESSVATWAASKIQAEVLQRLADGATPHMVRAPGRLDVMGGIAAYTGSLVVQMATEDHVCVALRERQDGTVTIEGTADSGPERGKALTIAIDRLIDASGKPIDAARLRESGLENADSATLIVLGTLVEMARCGVPAKLDKGLDVSVGTTLGGLCDAGHEAALAAATIVAFAKANSVPIDTATAVHICVAVGRRWSSTPIGAADASCVLIGVPHELMQFQYDPCLLVGTVPIPDDLLIVGLDCGDANPHASLKYDRAQTAAHMGCLLIDRIIRHDGTNHIQWDGHLSRLSITDYVERFRDRIPAKIKGSEYLERFGETGAPEAIIEPDVVYKVRSRTEHHIYEHTRACQFVECLSRAARSSDDRGFVEAGELMYASHWSYGQRCGLGGIESDRLVHLIRKHGTGSGVYGARVAGRGCGGSVVVCLRANDRASAALDAALADFAEQTGRPVRQIRGSSPGALHFGSKDS